MSDNVKGSGSSDDEPPPRLDATPCLFFEGDDSVEGCDGSRRPLATSSKSIEVRRSKVLGSTPLASTLQCLRVRTSGKAESKSIDDAPKSVDVCALCVTNCRGPGAGDGAQVALHIAACTSK